MRKTRRSFLGFVGSAVLLAACGQAAPPTPAPAPTTAPAKPAEAPKPAAAEPTKPAAAAPAAEPTKPAVAAGPTTAPAAAPAAQAAGSAPAGEFVFAGFSEPEFYKKQTDRFFQTKYPNLKVRYALTPGLNDFFVKIQTQMAAGEVVDHMLSHESRAQSMGFRGAQKPLDDLRKSMPFFVPESELFTVPVPLFSWDGKLYAWPNQMVSYGLAYNKSLFDKQKVAYPTDDWTWQDLADAAQKLTVTNAGKTESYGWVYWDDLTWPPGTYPALRAFGGDHFDKDQTKSLMNSDGSIAALTFMQDVWAKRKAAPVPSAAGQLGGRDAMFRQGIGAMSMVYFGNGNDIMKASKGKFDWAIANVPKGPAGRFMRAGGSAWAIPKTSSKPEVAWDFIRFHQSDLPTVKEIALDNFSVSHIPTYESTPPPGELGEYLGASWKKVFVDGLKQSGVAVSYSRIGVEYSPMLGAELAPLTDGSKTPKEVGESIASKANKLLADAK